MAESNLTVFVKLSLAKVLGPAFLYRYTSCQTWKGQLTETISLISLVWCDPWTVWSAQLVLDLPSYEPRHSGDWLVYWTVGTWTAASRKNKNLFTIITPLIPHTGEYVSADAASSVKMCFFDERSTMIWRLTENMRKGGSRNVLIGGCRWWWMGVILLEGQGCCGLWGVSNIPCTAPPTSFTMTTWTHVFLKSRQIKITAEKVQNEWQNLCKWKCF